MSRTRTTAASDTTAAPPARPSGVPDAQDIAVARALLLVHRLDPERHGCAGCGAACPCPVAQDAATVIVEAGAWNTIPFTNPLTQTRAGQERTGVLARLCARVTGQARQGATR